MSILCEVKNRDWRDEVMLCPAVFMWLGRASVMWCAEGGGGVETPSVCSTRDDGSEAESKER